MKGLILLVNGFEESEAIITIDLLRRANIEVDLVSLTNSIAVATGKSQISIMIIENQVVKSQSAELNLVYDNFTLAQRIQLFDAVSKDSARKYYQIEQMTQMNIDICQQIEEGMFK